MVLGAAPYCWIDHVYRRTFGIGVDLIEDIRELQIELILGDISDVGRCKDMWMRQKRMRYVC